RPSVRWASAAPSTPIQALSMLAAVRTVPRWTTLGTASPTRGIAPGRRAARLATTDMTFSGEAGLGVGAEMSSPMSLPGSTSTRPALIGAPPTSIPITLLDIVLERSKVGGGCDLHVAFPPSVLIPHPDGGSGYPGAHDEHHDGRQCVDIRA